MNTPTTTTDDKDTMRTLEKATLEVERNALRTALAVARGTILDLRSHLADLRAGQDFLRLSREAASAEAQNLREQFAAVKAELCVRDDLLQELHRREDALLAERNWLYEVRDAHAARLHELEPVVQQLAALTEERNNLTYYADALNRLVRDLRWEDGPRSVRIVLPLARLMRRVSGG